MADSSPLTAPETDLRDFTFMPLDVVRLRDSDLASGGDLVFRVGVLSWCASWHQVPAASLPDDDAALARLLGFGRDLKGWKKARAAGGLRGWVKCEDGRLYHPVVAEKANEAWQAKLARKARTEAARKAAEERRQQQSQTGSQTPSHGLSQIQSSPPSTDDVAESKGQGQEMDRTGRGTGRQATAAVTPPSDPTDLIGGAPPPPKPSERKVISSVFDRLANAHARIPREDEGKWQAMVDSFGEDSVKSAVRMVHSRGERAYFSAVREEIDRIPAADQPSIIRNPATPQPSLEDRAIAIANEIGWRAAADLIGDPIITTVDRLEAFLRDESNGYAQRLIDRAAKRGQGAA